MRDRARPAEAPECMDREDVDPGRLARALDALSRANRLFGGTRAVWRPVARDLRRRERQAGKASSAPSARSPSPREKGSPPRLTVADVGAGGGGMAAELARRLAARGWRPLMLLGDRHPAVLRIAAGRVGGEAAEAEGSPPEGAAARGRGRGDTPFRLVRLTAGRLPLATGAADYVVSATTLHHLEREEAVSFLREADRVARRGWVVADLRRSLPAYSAVSFLARTLWRRNPLPRRDGPVSVRRAFTPAEADELLREAGLPRARARAARPFRIALLGGSLARD